MIDFFGAIFLPNNLCSFVQAADFVSLAIFLLVRDGVCMTAELLLVFSMFQITANSAVNVQ